MSPMIDSRLLAAGKVTGISAIEGIVDPFALVPIYPDCVVY